MTAPVLVTGASGFVGSAVVRALLAEGQAVRVLLRPGSDRRNIDGLEVDIRTGTLEDGPALASAVAGCSALFHVAADYRLWVPDPAAMFAANVEGTRRLMTAAADAGVGRIIHTSSVATLGTDPAGAPADETTPVDYRDMIGPYKQSKFRAEAVVAGMVASQGLPAVIVNPSTPVGPRDIKPTPTGRVIVEAASGRMPAYVDTGLNLVHVEDVATGHVLAWRHGRIGERYVLGGDDLDLATMLGIIAGLVGRPVPRLRLPRRLIYPVAVVAELAARVSGREPFVTRDALRMAAKRMFFSSAKARRDLGYAPRPAAAGLAEAVAWFRGAGMIP